MFTQHGFKTTVESRFGLDYLKKFFISGPNKWLKYP